MFTSGAGRARTARSPAPLSPAAAAGSETRAREPFGGRFANTPLVTLPPVLAMRPRFIAKLWGGQRLRELPAKARAGHRPDNDTRTGEAWEVADLPEGSSVIEGGPHHGRPLRELVAKHAHSLVGARALPGLDGVLRFPLLVKLLDAGDDLSVQVHPGADYARTHPGTFAKDEAWLVVEVEAGARVLHGFVDGVTRDVFMAAIAEGRAHELLRSVQVSVGNVLRIAPGTMHAVGKGCLLLEVQEPSDTTFRVWDYRRLEHGKLRPLHVEQALAVARFGEQDPPLVADLAHRPLITEHFGMALVDVNAAAHVSRDLGEPAVLYVLDGEVHVEGTHLVRGATAIVCADAGDVHMTGNARVVVMTTGRGSA